ncbi:hypothetical protein ACVWZW_003504 [Bradyrhizobium sp. F1.13.4]
MQFRSDCVLPGWPSPPYSCSATQPQLPHSNAPVYHPSDTDAAIKETRAQTKTFEAMLAARGDRATRSIVSSVGMAHPNASAAQITNFVLALYCPLVRHNAALSEDQKRARLKSFSAELMKQVSP